MLLQDAYELAKLAAVVPTLIAAYKLPSIFRWCKMRLMEAFANAVMLQLTPELDKMSRQLSEVRHQVFPNSGSSMADRLNMTLASSIRTENAVSQLQATMRAHQDADLSQARFEADDAGGFLWASHALLRWCGKSHEQVSGYGWLNCIAQRDRDRVRAEWEASIEEHREFMLSFNMRDSVGSEFPVEAFAKPIHGVRVGTITRPIAT